MITMVGFEYIRNREFLSLNKLEKSERADEVSRRAYKL